jgi:single-stranded-DNA-specific exonuclease
VRDDCRLRLLDVERIVPHTDADGLAAGALALRARREPAAAAVLLGRGETPFGPDPPLPAASVAVLDWGVRELARPGILVDHHAPEAEPRGDQLVVSGYGEEPEVSTAVLVRRLLPEGAAWLAAVGAVGDLGDAGFALPECAGAPRAAVRRLVPLVNAPRRLKDGPVRVALELLVESGSPTAALQDPRAALLDEARRSWRAELERVRRTAPRVGDGVAVIRFASPAQVHPLVAAQWQRRLAPRVVLAANDGYLPGRVNFAVRGGTGDLRRLLRDALPEATGEFAHGHDRATGGSLTPEDFDLLLERLGVARAGVGTAGRP